MLQQERHQRDEVSAHRIKRSIEKLANDAGITTTQRGEFEQAVQHCIAEFANQPRPPEVVVEQPKANALSQRETRSAIIIAAACLATFLAAAIGLEKTLTAPSAGTVTVQSPSYLSLRP